MIVLACVNPGAHPAVGVTRPARNRRRASAGSVAGADPVVVNASTPSRMSSDYAE
jgi:hypothetical protein